MERTIVKSNLPWTVWGSGLWERLRHGLATVHVRRAPRRLRVSESVSLGEKRVVAVVEYEEQRFLVGGGAGSVNLLARLGEAPNFSELLTDWCERQR